MPGNAAVKSTARVALKGFWCSAVACAMLLIGTVFVSVYTSSVLESVFGNTGTIIAEFFACAFSFFVFIPLFFGVLRYFWRATADARDSILSVFYWFESLKRYRECLAFSFSLLIRLALTALAVFLPYIAVEIVSSLPAVLFSGQVRMHFMFLSSLFAAVGTILFVAFSVRFYAAPLLFVACEGCDRHEIIYLSKALSRKSAGAYLVLVVGMLGWILLSALGITLLYTVPYMLAAYVVHCRYAVNYYNRKAKKEGESDFPEYRSSF